MMIYIQMEMADFFRMPAEPSYTRVGAVGRTESYQGRQELRSARNERQARGESEGFSAILAREEAALV
ncbi:MAG: hypothetical protein IJR00_07550 [Lachnospiraceae bacterium]|nr:hypothetical protein [Lachnospiraceae bacterium]